MDKNRQTESCCSLSRGSSPLVCRIFPTYARVHAEASCKRSRRARDLHTWATVVVSSRIDMMDDRREINNLIRSLIPACAHNARPRGPSYQLNYLYLTFFRGLGSCNAELARLPPVVTPRLRREFKASEACLLGVAKRRNSR